MHQLKIITTNPIAETLLSLLAEKLPPAEEALVLLDAAQMERIKDFSGRKIILFTASADSGYLKMARKSGAAGFWYLRSSVEELARMLRGEEIFPEEAPKVQLGRVTGDDLTPREQDVLRQLVSGRSDAEIASALHCSLSTVKHYLQTLREKTGISSRVELAVRAENTGLIDFSGEKLLANIDNCTFDQ